MKSLTTKLGVVGIMLISCATLNAQTFTVQTGKWSSPSTWSSGIVPDSTAGPITVNHKIALSADTILKVDELILNDTLVIEAGSTLLLRNAQNKIPDLQIITGGLKVYGRLVCLDSTNTSGTTTDNTFFYAGSTYEHRFFSVAGTPPVATWSINSNLEITGYTSGKSLNDVLWSQSFGNVIYNCPGQSTFVELLGRVNTIKGNFSILNTNGNFLRFSYDATVLPPMIIGGDLIITGNSKVWFSRGSNLSVIVEGDFRLLPTSNGNVSTYVTTTGNCDITVEGDFEMNTNSTLRFASATASGRGILRVKENFIFTSGNIDVASGGDGLGTVELTGPTSQLFTSLGEWRTGVNLLINNNAGVEMEENSTVEGNIVVAPNGKLILPETNFALHGNLTVQSGGLVEANEGVLTLAGSGNQSLSLAGDTLHHIHVNKSSGSSVTFSNATMLSGILSVISTNTTVHSNGNLTLLSSSDDGNADALINTLPTGSSLLGNVAVQRYMSGEGRIYRYLSSPVSNASVDSLMDDFPITGTFDNPSTGPGIIPTSLSFFYYDETLPNPLGWVNYPSTGLASENILEAGRGYSGFIREAVSATTWDVTGIINQGNISLPVTFTDTNTPANDGWNLVGNPYPSSIDWSSAVGWSKINIDDGIAVRDNSIGGFLYWDGEVGSLGSGRIAKGQSFWIKTNALNPELIIKETAKTSALTTFYREKISQPDFLEIRIQKNDQQDKTYLRLRDHAKNEYDSLDVVKFQNDFINLSFETNKVSLAISAINELNCSHSYPINLSFAKKSNGTFVRSPIGDYKIAASTFGIFANNQIVLRDRFTNQDFNIALSPYAFSITEDSASFKNDRFSLHFDAPVLNDSAFILFDSVFCATSLSYKMELKNTQQNTRYKIFTNDRLIDSYLSQGNDSLSVEIDSEELNDGFTNLKVGANNLCYSKQIWDFNVWKQDVSPPKLIAETACNTDSTTLHIQKSKYAYVYQWYDHTNILIAQTQDSSLVVAVQKPTTFHASTVFYHECVSDQSSVHVDVVQYDLPLITENQGVLYSNHSNNNQWSLDGAEITGANQSTFEPTTTGNYSLTVLYNGCVDSVSHYFIYQDDASHVFPNPAENEIHVVAPRDEQILRIEIINTSGQSIKTFFSESNAKAEIITLDDLTSGIYSLNLITTKKQYRTRILKK